MHFGICSDTNLDRFLETMKTADKANMLFCSLDLVLSNLWCKQNLEWVNILMGTRFR